MHKQYICLNGEMFPFGDPCLMHNNRAFCYGDAIFETIHANGTKMQFFTDHYSRLQRSMDLLHMKKGSLPDQNALEQIIIKLLNKNHLYNGVRVRLSVFRNSGGFYTPHDNTVSYLAETLPLPEDEYRLNKKGLKTAIFNGLLKQADSLANLKTSNSLLYIRAGLFCEEQGIDDCFIMNTEGRLAESVSSNIFLLKNGNLLTPSLDQGCVEGIMRLQILRLAADMGVKCIETPLLEEDLLEADECFLTNAITGIRWVVAYSHKRYYNKTANMLIAALNREQFKI
jgi:branched-subunit amino acid aminotransferase/4-amino-4-deoxychorismate lyase